MSTTTRDGPSTGAPSMGLRAVAGLVPLLIAGLVTVVGFLVAGPASALQAVREAGMGFWLVVPSTLVAALAAGVLVAFMPGVRVPAALPIAIGTWPWLAGLAGASWGAAQVEAALQSVDPSMRAVLMAQGLSEALLGRVIGGIAGAGTLVGIALALAIASVAPRAPNRSALGAVAGLVAGGVPLAIGLGFAILGGGLAGSALLVGIALLGTIACAIAGYGAGADLPHARAASLAAAAPLAALLALACAGGAAAILPMIEVFGAIAAADPAARVEILASFGDEIEIPVALAKYGWALALLACAVISGWAAARARPSAGRVVGAVAALVVAVATLALGAGAEGATYAMLEARVPAPWDGVEGFEPLVARAHDAPSPALVLGVDRIVSSGGQSAPLAGIEAPGPARDAIAALVRGAIASAGGDLPDGSELARGSEDPALAIALDGRTTGATLRALITIADAERARSIAIVGVGQRVDPATLARVPAGLRGIASSLDLRADRALLLRSIALDAPEDARLLHGRIVPAHESTTLTLEARPGAEGETIPARVEGPGWGEPPSDGTLVYLAIDPATPASTVTSVVARVRATGHVPVLLAGDDVPGNPSQPSAGAWGGLGLEGTGIGSDGSAVGGIGLGSIGTLGSRAHGTTSGGTEPQVLGSLSADVIRRVVRRNLAQIQHCYEQGLARTPSLAGRVELRWIIADDGSVASSEVGSSTLGDVQVEGCMASAVRRWAFPAPDGGGIVRVTYPFVLSASP